MAFLAAVVQLTSTTDVEASLKNAEMLVREAKARGAKLVVLPENTSFMGTDEEKRRVAEPIDGPTFSRLSALAKAEGLWLIGGTLPEKGPTAERTFNTSAVFSPEGTRVAVYRKIHLFDIALGEGATFKESNSVVPGDHAVVAETALAKIGLSVCYDLRFAALYRALVFGGAELLTVPAAFTVPTGRDHWEVLLRARAIENQCYVLAAGQFGQNSEKRTTFGRSMIIDPWGTVLALCPDRMGIAMAEIDLDHLRRLRANLPCLQHERPGAYHVR